MAEATERGASPKLTATLRTPAAPPTAPPPPAKAVTWRSVLIGFGLVPCNALWIVNSEVVRYAGHPTTTSLFFNVVFCVAVLVALNAFLKRYWPRAAFTQGELLVVYTILSLGSAMVGHDMMQVLLAAIAHPYQYATPENRWPTLFLDVLPRALMMDDKEVLRGYFYGNTSLYQGWIILAWLRPVLLWTGFFTVLAYMMMCLNTIWRKQWTENERLSFPIVELPLQMTDEHFTLFRSKAMWAGFILAGGIDLVNTISRNYPAFPHVPIRDIDLAQHITERPWNAIGSTPLNFFPFVIGIGYLLPLDLSFSCWFFQLFWKAQRVMTSAYGWGDGRPDFPYIPEQSAGAYVGVAVFVVWVSRHYLREVFRKAFGQRSELDDSREAMSYRHAVFGFLGGMIAVVLFSIFAGMTPWIAVAFMGIYMLLSVCITRMRAELGSPAHDLHHAGPNVLLTEIIGPQDLSRSTLASFAVFGGFNRAYRSHPMPHQIEGLKVAQLTGIRMRPFVVIMLLATLWGTLCAFWALLHVYYDLGAATAKITLPNLVFGWEPYRWLERQMKSPRPIRDPLSTWFMAGGLGFSLFLTAMRGQFLWWPFHPVGLAVSSSWAMNYMWFPLALAWVAKACILRATGLRGYRAALPFFLGLILGEFVIGSLCNLAGLFWGLEIYRFWG